MLCMAFAPHEVAAKIKPIDKMYMFGFSASFKDSIVYFTDIQAVDSAWIDTKTKFLQGRELYSEQLKNHLATNLNESNRTCIVMFAKKRSKLEKKYLKLKRLYTIKAKGLYDVRYLNNDDFKFKTVVLDFSE